MVVDVVVDVDLDASHARERLDLDVPSAPPRTQCNTSVAGGWPVLVTTTSTSTSTSTSTMSMACEGRSAPSTAFLHDGSSVE